MRARDKVRLLFGPYQAPPCSIGDELPCEIRGLVPVRCMSTGRIRWPQTRVKRATGFIVCGGLAEAVRRESATAICHWWGVTAQTVTKWRKLMNVPTYNEGTKRLWRELSAEFLTPEVQERARRLANSPAGNAKKRLVNLGRKPSPRQALALARRRQKLAAINRARKKRRGRPPDWDRLRLVVELRAQGWAMPRIARENGWTKQYVHALLRLAQKARIPMPVNCCACGEVITTRSDYSLHDSPVLCVACLCRRREATFGERLRAYRVARGMTQLELCSATGLGQSQISGYERDARQPAWRNVARMVKVFGVNLILNPDPAPSATKRRRQRQPLAK